MNTTDRILIILLASGVLLASSGHLWARNHDSGSRSHDNGSRQHTKSGRSSDDRFGISPKFKIDRLKTPVSLKMDSLD